MARKRLIDRHPRSTGSFGHKPLVALGHCRFSNHGGPRRVRHPMTSLEEAIHNLESLLLGRLLPDDLPGPSLVKVYWPLLSQCCSPELAWPSCHDRRLASSNAFTWSLRASQIRSIN